MRMMVCCTTLITHTHLTLLELFLTREFLSSVDIIGQDAPECAASDMSVYGGVQMGGGGPSEANYSVVSNHSRTDPDLESKRKAYVSYVT